MSIRNRPWLFELGSLPYGWFTRNRLWERSCALLASFVPPPAADGRSRHVLDLGCGPGVSTIEVARARRDCRLIGVDLSPAMIRLAARQSARTGLDSVSYVIADAGALPFRDDAFDAAIGHSFLYLLRDRAHVLREAYRVISPGGRFASMEPRTGATSEHALISRWRDLRYLVSVGLWRPYSRYHGRFDEESFPRILEVSGLVNTGTTNVLDGLGIVGYGEK